MAEPLHTTAEAVEDGPDLLMGRETCTGNGRKFHTDLRLLGVPAYKIKHDAGCKCDDALPIGCDSGGRSAGAAAVGDRWQRCLRCGEVLRHRNYSGAGDTCDYCLPDAEAAA